MNNSIIFTDSCCDIAPQRLTQWGVSFADMIFSLAGEDKEYINADMSNKANSTAGRVHISNSR